MEKQITFKQQRFVEEYPVDRNATQAAIRAGYSKKTAYSQGQRLLKNVEVAKAIETGHEILRKRCAVSVESLTEELEEARLLAMADEKGASAAVSAIMGMAKLHGLVVDKKEMNMHDLSNLNREERGILIDVLQSLKAERLATKNDKEIVH